MHGSQNLLKTIHDCQEDWIKNIGVNLQRFKRIKRGSQDSLQSCLLSYLANNQKQSNHKAICL
jgi:hypothetical protein